MKKIFKSFLYLSSLTVVGGAISPFLISCASNTSKPIIYNPTNSSIEINSSNINIFDNKNIFSVYTNIITYQNDNSDVTSKKYIEKMNDELAKVINKWLVQNNYNELNILFDVSNITVGENWSLLVPVSSTTVLNKSLNRRNIDIKTVRIDFPKISAEQIKQITAKNIYTESASNAFPNKTLEQIKELPSNDILKVLSGILPSKTIIWDFPIEGVDPLEIVYDEETQQKTLNILIFIPGEHLGMLKLSYSDNQITSPGPSQTLKDEFGEELNSYWPSFAQLQMTTLEQLNFTKVDSGISSQILPSYKDVLQTKNIKTQITEYSTKQKYLDNFEQDLIFYLKNYFANLSIEWDNKSLLLSDIFVTKIAEIDKSTGKLNAKLGIDIHNNSVGTRRLKLPITNEEITLERNDVITIIIDWKNSDIQPFLKQIGTRNSAYLTTSFNNVNIKSFKQSDAKNNRFLMYSSSWSNTTNNNDFQNIFPVSYSLKKVVDNVGFGKTLLESNAEIQESFAALTEDDLKNARLNTLNQKYDLFLDILKSVQGIALKSAKNPTFFDFLQSINLEFYDMILALNGDTRIASIISDIFSKKKLSEYLQSNISNIISLLEESRTPDDSSMDIIIDMLTMIESTNPTLEEKQEWVKSIEGLYPTLEKLLGANLQWIMPLIQAIMSSISAEDPSVVQLLFHNMDFVLQFIQLPENKDKLGEQVVGLVKLISKYLDELIEFGKEMIREINSNPDKYKTIRVLDILAYELIEKDASKTSLFAVIIEVVKLIDPSSSIIGSIQQIQAIVGDQVSLPKILKDYSTATFENELGVLGNFKNFKVVKETIVHTKLSKHLGTLIESIFNVYVNDSKETIDLYTMFVNNTNIQVEKHNFSLGKNKNVSQELNIKFSFKQNVQINLIPLCVIVDNLVIKDGKQISTNTLETTKTLEVVKPLYWKGVTVPVLYPNGLPIGAMLPINIVIQKDINYYKMSFNSLNEEIYPVINNNGDINWTYNSQQDNLIEFENVLKDSNKDRNDDKKTKNYYGDSYSVVKLAFNTLSIIAFKDIWSIFTQTTTQLSNPKKIENYNSAIHLNGATVTTKNKSNEEISSFFTSFINNYGQWTKSQWDTNRNQFSLKDNHDFENKLKEYLEFGLLFTSNPYVKYNIGFDSIHYKLQIETYQYALVIKFNFPISYIVTKDGVQTTIITNELRFTITSDKQPTPTNNFKN